MADTQAPEEVSSEFSDKTLKCKVTTPCSLPAPAGWRLVYFQDCDAEWVFSAGEQQFYSEKAFENEPSRCKDCRKAKKIARNRKLRGKRQTKKPAGAPGGNFCYAFQKGECTRGETCRFAHELAPAEEVVEG
jgi:hypothetical protein